MAANMLKVLKQINRNIIIIEGKVSEIDKKMDQQQITIDNLEQPTDKSDLVSKNNETDLMDESEEYIGNTEINLLENPSINSLNRMCQTEANCGCDNKINDDKNTHNIVLESITNELREIKDFLRDFEATMKNTSLDEDNVVPKSPTHSNADQISKLREELKRYRDEIKDYIKNSGATEKIIDEAVSSDEKEVEKKEEIVQISPTYFSSDQISKLNTELKRIAQTYRSTNTIPIIEVLPGGQEHPVMIQLRKGVTYKTIIPKPRRVKIKLGVDGFQSCEVQRMLDEYPDLTLTDVVQELLKYRNWDIHQIDFRTPFPYHS